MIGISSLNAYDQETLSDECRDYGGALLVSAQSADREEIRALIVIMPIALKPTNYNRGILFSYRADVEDSIYRCVPGPVDGGTDFDAITACMAHVLAEKHDARPAVVIGAAFDVIADDMRRGGVMEVEEERLGLKAFVLPHHNLVGV